MPGQLDDGLHLGLMEKSCLNMIFPQCLSSVAPSLVTVKPYWRRTTPQTVCFLSSAITSSPKLTGIFRAPQKLMASAGSSERSTTLVSVPGGGLLKISSLLEEFLSRGSCSVLSCTEPTNTVRTQSCWWSFWVKSHIKELVRPERFWGGVLNTYMMLWGYTVDIIRVYVKKKQHWVCGYDIST